MWRDSGTIIFLSFWSEITHAISVQFFLYYIQMSSLSFLLVCLCICLLLFSRAGIAFILHLMVLYSCAINLLIEFVCPISLSLSFFQPIGPFNFFVKLWWSFSFSLTLRNTLENAQVHYYIVCFVRVFDT